ncbi:MAG: LPS export ABC transporter periplasmic protein LptC [Chitinophagaceae bacterium]|jgi:LPS export ABC transporter protein LptC|nr:LPS export ABC transporter periplasmic protein LptC [Chitinophagaceae bacterium]
MFGLINANMINTLLYKNTKLAVALLSSCFFMLSCENNVNDVQALSARIGGIDVGKDVSIFISTDGKMTAKLMAPLMRKYLLDSGRMVEFPNTIKVDFYKDSLHIESKLSADYANYKEEENKVFLKDNVIVYNVLGDTLWCKEMIWDQVTNKFTTDKEVIVKQHNPIAKIYGKGFEANQDLSDIHIFKPQSNSFAILSDSTGSNPK